MFKNIILLSGSAGFVRFLYSNLFLGSWIFYPFVAETYLKVLSL